MTKISERDLGYIAGIVDGEGCITIVKQAPNKLRKEKNSRYGIVCQVANTDKRLIDWLHDCFGGSIRITEKREKWRTAWTWAIRSTQAFKFLKLIRDYSLIKQNQIDLVIEFQTKCVNITQFHPVPLWLTAKRERYFQKIKEMHHV